ncbi:MAG: histidinol-phosphate transaminase [Kineosporiaceae bacterium]
MSGHLRHVRPALAHIPQYIPGRVVGGDGPTHKLSSNENPYSPVPAVRRAAAAALESSNRYPDLAATALVTAIADFVGVAPDRVVVGTGSVGVLAQVLQATCEPGDEVVSAWRSFEAYPIAARVAGARLVPVPLTADGRHDLAEMARAVTDRTRLVLVCTPNNPTGPAVHGQEVLDLLAVVAGRCPVVLDEAYVEFVRDPRAVDALALAAARDDVVVLRTFSKAHGLASLRVGYGVTGPAIADAMRATAVPFGVSAVAQAAALAALEAWDEVAAQVALIIAERARVAAGLAGAGWRIPEPQGNFVWLPVGDATDDLVTAFADQGIAVRGFSGEGVRVSIGEPAANDLVLEILRNLRWAGVRGA